MPCTTLVFDNLDFKNGTKLKVVFLEPAHQYAHDMAWVWDLVPSAQIISLK